MTKPTLIVIGASAGGVEALTQVVKNLPADLAAAILIVVHVPSGARSVLPKILSRHGKLPISHAVENEPIQAGHIYIAPPDHHLIVQDGRLRLDRGPRQNGHRPAIDPLFQTAARARGQRVIGVILSGARDDGTLGLRVVKMRGGLTVVQDPEDALYPDMPRSAIDHATVDHVMTAGEIGNALADWVKQLDSKVEVSPMAGKSIGKSADNSIEELEAEIVAQDKAAQERGERTNGSTLFTCPDCGGVLWELEENGMLRYRCHIGHVYSAESLQGEHAETLENAMWTAVRTLEESAALARRMANRARSNNSLLSAERFDQRAQSDEERAALVRRALEYTRDVSAADENVAYDPDTSNEINEQA